MDNKRKNLIFFFVLVEIIIIFALGYKIINKKTVLPLKKEVLTFNSRSNLKYFYEPKANTKETIDRWTLKKAIPQSIDTNNVYYSINLDSLNERFDYSVNKSSDIFRIITLGDSFTFGVFVNTKDNWTEKLEDLLNQNIRCNKLKKIEVINLGVPGYDIEYSVERFKIRGIKYNPDLVIWFLKKDDFTQIGEIFRPELNHIEKNINSISDKSTGSKKDYETLFSSWFEVINNYTINKIGEQKMLDYQLLNLEKINNYYKGSLLIFTFPLIEGKYQSIITKFVNSRNNTYFYNDITHIYKNNNLYLSDGHPSKKGYEVIASDLYQYLTKNKFIPCN